ncbi:MAG: hypothetical protein ACRDDH_21225, partial [Cetobacterium sp.]|uniref:hypothetical protein n=1 Tax=Cetobacterium sp. TaxID=2071632 RepID=UPI003EE52EBC
NSKVIILNNSDLATYNLLKKYQNEDFLKKNFKKQNIINKKNLWIWEDEEINYLKKYYFLKTLEEISFEIKKSFYQISLKALELKLVGVKNWENDELEFFEQNIELSNYELGKLLKRSIHSIKAKKRILKKKIINQDI